MNDQANCVCVTDPVLIVEVLSPSTERHEILKKYRSIRLCSRIEHWHRQTGEAEWDRILLPRDGETLTVGAVEFEIALDEVYECVILGKL